MTAALPAAVIRRRSVVPVGAWGGIILAVASALGVAAFLWPFLGRAGGSAELAHAADAPWVLLAVMPVLVAVLVAELTAGRLDAKAVAMLGVLTAAGTALRMPTGGIAGLELVFFLFIPAGRVFGRGFGFVLGATTLFTSALMTGGVGPWLPFQMLAAGWVGLGAACLPAAKGRAEIVLLGAYAVVAAYTYGLVMDLWFWPFGSAYGSGLSFVAGDPVGENLRRFWAFHLVTSMGWDTGRAISLVVMCAVAGRPVLSALRRAARRAAFDAQAVFGDEVEFDAEVQFDLAGSSLGDRQPQGESGAAVGLVADLRGSPVFEGDPRNDGQPQPHAGSHPGVVGLPEAVEHVVERVGVHSGPVIPDADHAPRPVHQRADLDGRP